MYRFLKLHPEALPQALEFQWRVSQQVKVVTKHFPLEVSNNQLCINVKGFQNHSIKQQFIRDILTGMAKIFILYGIILYLKLCKQIYLIKIFGAV